MPQSDQYQEITKELYSKNADLVNANKIFELIQRLYEIMISCYTIESISQRFIDVIIETLGFTDGVVATRYEKNQHLHVIGITQTQINKTLLELANTATVDLNFSLDHTDNALVRVYLSGNTETVTGISKLWTPYLKRDDVAGIDSVIGQQRILVYPIIFGDTVLGSFGLTLGSGVQQLTEFEKKALERLVTVFGVAIDRVRINTELHESEKRELAKTKELLKLKDEFVFIATHDLKTPVVAINGFIELIEDSHEKLSDSITDSFAAIKESSTRLNQLTNDLLQVARSDSGTIAVTVGPVDIIGTLEQGIQEVSVAAQEKNITISLDSDTSDRMVMADKARLSEVMENLLSNAIKYNRHGGTVTVTSKKVAEIIEISIRDTGLGIPKDQQEKIFQKFFRAHQKGAEGVTGTGLGLFVVKMLVEKMGGTVRFTSEEGKGSVFIVSLLSAS